MAIKSIRADFGKDGADGIIFLGGATALNWLGEVSAGTAVPKRWEGMLNEFLRCQDGLSFKLGGCEIIKNGYYVKAKGMAFKETEHGTKGPAYWELAKNVASKDKVKLAAQMRGLLEFPGTECGDPWVATLTAAMFLSEVVRNPRSFMINLMLLDLIEGGVKYGRAQTKELDFGKLLKFDSAGAGKTKTYQYSDGAMTVGKADGAEEGTMRGGKLPMSQKGAAAQYEAGVKGFEHKKNFNAYAKQSTLNLNAPSSPGVDYHFATPLLEKECTVLLQWLAAYFSNAQRAMNYQTGSEPVQAEVKGWNGTVTTTVQKPITVPVSLTALRNHMSEGAWIDATTADKRTSKLKTGVTDALKARQGGVKKLP